MKRQHLQRGLYKYFFALQLNIKDCLLSAKYTVVANR